MGPAGTRREPSDCSTMVRLMTLFLPSSFVSAYLLSSPRDLLSVSLDIRRRAVLDVVLKGMPKGGWRSCIRGFVVSRVVDGLTDRRVSIPTSTSTRYRQIRSPGVQGAAPHRVCTETSPGVRGRPRVCRPSSYEHANSKSVVGCTYMSFHENGETFPLEKTAENRTACMHWSSGGVFSWCFSPACVGLFVWVCQVAGLSPVKSVRGIENYDVTGLVKSHAQYPEKMSDILAFIGFDA